MFVRIKEIEYAPLLRLSNVDGCDQAPSEVVVCRTCRPHPSVGGPVHHARRAVYNAYRTPVRHRPSIAIYYKHNIIHTHVRYIRNNNISSLGECEDNDAVKRHAIRTFEASVIGRGRYKINNNFF